MPDSPVRAMLDANVLTSALATTRTDGATFGTVEAALERRYTLVLSERVVAEVIERTSNRPFLARTVSPDAVERLIRLLRVIAEAVPEIDETYPEVGPDRRDDYLFVHAVTGRADYLVSGDRSVLSIGRIGAVEIVTPARFVEILRTHGHLLDR